LAFSSEFRPATDNACSAARDHDATSDERSPEKTARGTLVEPIAIEAAAAMLLAISTM